MSEEIRQKVVSLIRQYDGVSVTSARDKYVDLLGPDETKAMQDYFCEPKTSGCALTIRGLWRKLGVSDAKVLPAYKFGTAISLLVEIAKKRDAWTSLVRARGANLLPMPGDTVLVGGNKETDGGVEHVFTVASCDIEGDSVVLTSVDGGQRDSKGQQAIFEKKRRWKLAYGSWWDVSAHGSDPGSGAPGGRRVMGFADIAKILAFEQKG